MIILQAIKEHADMTPNKIAVIEGKKEISYSELWNNITKLSGYFEKIGKAGDRVVLAANKSVDFVYAYFGAQLAGLITIPIASDVNAIRLQRIMSAAEPIGIFGNLSLQDESFPVKEFPNVHAMNAVSYTFPNEESPADIMFTTGTTGMPKGVVLTHLNEMSAAVNINSFIGNSCDEVELLALPISHSFGIGRLRCTLLKGATLDMLGSFANMKKFFREMEERKATGFGMVPASWKYISKMSGERIADFKDQLKYIEIGSAPMPLNDKKHLVEMLPNTRICMHYGLTEASRSAFICFNEDLEHLDSIGHPTPNVEIKIFDENGNIVPDGDNGEICVKGGHVCSAYWGDSADKYADSFYGEYFRTGDWGYVDSDGYYHLISRQKELINVGGKKVSPIEVEEVINQISGVAESVCVARHDDVYGETVKAFVVIDKSSGEAAKITPDSIISYTRDRLEQYKVPTDVEFIDEVPKTSSGKVQRLSLKQG